MKKFSDLSFIDESLPEFNILRFRAFEEFDNGYAVSVIKCNVLNNSKTSPYELAILKNDEIDEYNPLISGGVLSDLSEKDISNLMVKIQLL